LELNNKAGEIVSKCKFINREKFLFTDKMPNFRFRKQK